MTVSSEGRFDDMRNRGKSTTTMWTRRNSSSGKFTPQDTNKAARSSGSDHRRLFQGIRSMIACFVNRNESP